MHQNLKSSLFKWIKCKMYQDRGNTFCQSKKELGACRFTVVKNQCFDFTILKTIKGPMVSTARSVYNLQGHILLAFPNNQIRFLQILLSAICYAEVFNVLYLRKIISIPEGLSERLQCNFLSSNNYLFKTSDKLCLSISFSQNSCNPEIHALSTFM